MSIPALVKGYTVAFFLERFPQKRPHIDIGSELLNCLVNIKLLLIWVSYYFGGTFQVTMGFNTKL